MGKVKVHRTPPSLDMTPMVDLAFLLVTFFMLTTKFNPVEPVQVTVPSSTAVIKIPDTDILTLTISKDGAVFFNVDGKYTRQRLIKEIGTQYKVNFSNEQIERFSVLTSFGVPVQALPEYLDSDPEERDKIKQPGIPTDSLNNQLRDWIVFSRMSNPKLRIAIKGDSKANYPVIKSIITTLQDNNISRFNLITNTETEQ